MSGWILVLKWKESEYIIPHWLPAVVNYLSALDLPMGTYATIMQQNLSSLPSFTLGSEQV